MVKDNLEAEAAEWKEKARQNLLDKGVPGKCVLDIPLDEPIKLHHYATGSYELAKQDLGAALSPLDYEKAAKIFEKAEVELAFSIRSQLINFKKVCLHLYHYGQTELKKRLTRSTHVFYYHNYKSVESLRTLLPLNSCSWTHLYEESSDAYQQLKGVLRVLYDMRFVTKHICNIPRHPLQKLDEVMLNLPQKLLLCKSFRDAQKFLTKYYGSAIPDDSIHAKQEKEEESALLNELRKSFDRFKADFIEQTMIARGIVKALRISGHLKQYIAILRKGLKICDETVINLKTSILKTDNVAIIKESKRHMQILSSSSACVKGMLEILKSILKEPSQVLIAASDDVNESRGAIFLFEEDFKEVSVCFNSVKKLTERHAPILNDIIQQCINDNGNLEQYLSFRGADHCKSCKKSFSRHWLIRGICPLCDSVIRSEIAKRCDSLTSNLEVCPYRTRCSKSRFRTLCPHHGKCFACDRWSCKLCKIMHGDGEFVSAFVIAMKHTQRVLFFDFDRTFATTKHGGSPLKGKRNHSLDPHLKALALTHDDVHVVTRNSHEEDILKFLNRHELHHVQVHCVKRQGKDKHEIINSLCSSDGSKVGIFVDDDIQEVCHERLVENESLYCILFSRILL